MTAPADESLQQLLVLAIDVVEEAARTADRRPEALEIGTKANRNDLVTQVDRAIEDAVARRLLDETGLPLLGEEGHAIDSYSGRVWVLDPIDGTMNYVETRRDYAVSLALCEDGAPVLGVVADVEARRIYTAVAGGGAACDGAPLENRAAGDPIGAGALPGSRASPCRRISIQDNGGFAGPCSQ